MSKRREELCGSGAAASERVSTCASPLRELPSGSPAEERGSALVLALILLASLIVLAGAFAAVALTETHIAANEIRSAVAFGIAEGGLDHAVTELGDVDVDELLNGGGELFVNEALGDGNYSVIVSNNVAPEFPTGRIPEDLGGADNDTDDLLVVTSLGTFQDAMRAVEVIVVREATIFDVAIYAADSVRTTGAAVVAGTVGSGGSMILSDETTVAGNAYATAFINDAKVVSGTAIVGEPPRRMLDIGCPDREYGPPPVGPGVSFDPFTGDLVIDTGSEIDWPRGASYFHDFIKRGEGDLVVGEDDRADIVVGGSLTIEERGFLNENEASADLQIWSCGDDDGDWVLKQDGESWMTIYAPRHRLRLGGDGTLRGSLLVGELLWSGDGAVGYDAQISESAPFVRVRGTWSERF